MTIHSASRPIFGNQITALSGASIAAGAKTTVVSSPPSNKARMVSGVDSGSSGVSLALEELPLSFHILNDSLAGALVYRLMLMGAAGFPAGIEIQRNNAGVSAGTIEKFDHCIALVPGERIELEILLGSAATSGKITASYKDFSREIVRVGRVLLPADNSFVDVIPPPPAGSQLVPIVGGSGGSELAWVNPCFYTNQDLVNAGNVALQLKSGALVINRSSTVAVPGADQANMEAANVVLGQNQSLQANNIGDSDLIIAITAWLEISEPATV